MHNHIPLYIFCFLSGKCYTKRFSDMIIVIVTCYYIPLPFSFPFWHITHLPSLHLCHLQIIQYIKIIKNEKGCRDDTVPKTSDTGRPCEVGV